MTQEVNEAKLRITVAVCVIAWAMTLLTLATVLSYVGQWQHKELTCPGFLVEIGQWCIGSALVALGLPVAALCKRRLKK